MLIAALILNDRNVGIVYLINTDEKRLFKMIILSYMSTVVAPMRKAVTSVTEVTVMETPACLSASAIRS